MNIKVDRNKLEVICKKYQVEFLGVFGSMARGEAKFGSDLDVLVRFDKSRKVTFIDLEDAEDDLERLFEKQVDLVTLNSVSPFMKNNILRDVQPVYGKI